MTAPSLAVHGKDQDSAPLHALQGPSFSMPELTEVQRREVEETRELLEYAVECAQEIPEEGDGKTLKQITQEVETFWLGLDAWKLAGMIDQGRLHELPEFVAGIAIRDTRQDVVRALERDTARMTHLTVRHRDHLRALLKEGDLLERGRAIMADFFRRAERHIHAGERPSLDPHEVELGAFAASHIPTRQMIEVLLPFARTYPGIANALLDNSLVNTSSGGENRAGQTELLTRIMDVLLPVAAENEDGNLTHFLVQAYDLALRHPELKVFRTNIEEAIRGNQEVIITLIATKAIQDEVIRDIVSIQFVRQHAGSPEWNRVFMALRRYRYDYFFSSRRNPNVPRGGKSTGDEIQKVARTMGNRELVDFFANGGRTSPPFGTT